MHALVILLVQILDVLLYLGEALLPFVDVFYTNFYQFHSKTTVTEIESSNRKLFTAILVSS